jgi:predicted phosphodiesterase
MKIALLTDIHANLPAFQAVVADMDAWRPDRVIIGGDLVNRGTRPKECLDLALDRQATDGWLFLRGNHEDYVISHGREGAPRHGPRLEAHRASFWTYEQLGGDMEPLRAMPESVELSGPDGKPLRFYHGSVLGLREGIYPETSEAHLHARLGLNGDRPPHRLALFGVGHTHRPLIRTHEGVLVVNAGSAGMPFDFDTRPSYAQIWWEQGHWQARIVRVDYDLAAAAKDFETSGFMQQGGPLAQLILIELLEAHSMLYNWALKYQDAVMEGKISMEDSVSEYLRNHLP